MEDISEEHVALFDHMRKDKRPFIEMEITSLVECEPPIFTATNYSHDSMALLEAGYNKEIERNTATLCKQEKEIEGFQAILQLLEKEANNTLSSEEATASPVYKLFVQFKTEHGSLAIKKCNQRLTNLDNSTSALRSKMYKATNELQQLSKSTLKKTKGAIYERDGKFYSKWTTIPAKLISEFQTVKESPLQVYLEMRNLAVVNPEKITHDAATKLIRRYKEALPNDALRAPVKEYYTKRLEELRQLELKDTYTKAVLLKYMATMVSDIDAHTIEGYLEANGKSVAMRELANSVIKTRMTNLLRQTALKPMDQLLPLNPTNKQHQMFHKLAVEEKALPKALRASPNPTHKKPQPTQFKAKRNFKKQIQNNQPYQRQQKSTPTKKQFSGAQRPRSNTNNFQNNFVASRGAPKSKQQNNGTSKLAKTPADAVAQLRDAYDITKISDQLEHFGNTTPEVQLMLQHQLVQRSLDVAPNPKKPSKTPNSAA